MTSLDWIIIAFTLLMAVWGYARGLIVGFLSLAGFLGGGFLGSRIAPLVLSGGAHSPYAPVFALVGAFLLGALLASGLEAIGFGLRQRFGRALGLIDGVGGGVLLAAAGLGLCWIAGAVALQTPGATGLRPDIQRSQILSALNRHLPPSGSLLNALARFDPFPHISGPAPGVAPPTSSIARSPGVRAAERSVVRVLGSACGLGIEGSGWIARAGVVVTNAHVVAGETDTTVELRGRGERLSAQVIGFDPRNDIAVLRVGGLTGAPALALNEGAGPGTSAAILGFPENGPFTVAPGRVGRTSTFLSQDAYGRGPIQRRITSLRGLVRSGNSGGPMVDSSGRVVATIFAATVGGGSASGFGVPDSIVAAELARAGRPVGTGPCAH